MTQSSWAAALLPHAPDPALAGTLLRSANRVCGSVVVPVGIELPGTKHDAATSAVLARNTTDAKLLARFVKDPRKVVRAAVADNPALEDEHRLVLASKLTETETDAMDAIVAAVSPEHLPEVLEHSARIWGNPFRSGSLEDRLITGDLDECLALVAALRRYDQCHSAEDTSVPPASWVACLNAASRTDGHEAVYDAAGPWRPVFVAALTQRHCMTAQQAAWALEDLDALDAVLTQRARLLHNRAWRCRRITAEALDVLTAHFEADTLFPHPPHPALVKLLAGGAGGSGSFWAPVVEAADRPELFAILYNENAKLTAEVSAQMARRLLDAARFSERDDVAHRLLDHAGLDLDSDVVVELLRAGTPNTTSHWLRGELARKPRPGEITALVADPGTALENPNCWAPSPSRGVLPLLVSQSQPWADEFVDVFGLGVVRDHIHMPVVGKWLAGRVSGALGDEAAAWEQVTAMAPTWVSSLTALLDTVRATQVD